MKMIVANYLTILQNCDLHFFINNPNFEITSILLNSIQVGGSEVEGRGAKSHYPQPITFSSLTSSNIGTSP